MGGIGPWQILIIVLIILLLFGAAKLPNLARSMGRSMRIFKSEVNEMKKDGKSDGDGDPEAIDGPVEPTEEDRIASDFSSEAPEKKNQ
ncbi:MAG: Sec-independent protein translocase subunit TatA [Mycobacteriaceae bacterium]|uniref:Sec-independent protein translocase subunit TatA n=1 Tax=Corynebacterium sp. TaxID=1720 RepID=UPI003F9A0A15